MNPFKEKFPFLINTDMEDLLDQANSSLKTHYHNILDRFDQKRTMKKKDDRYIYQIEMPGYEKQDIKVKNSKETRRLHISATCNDPITDDKRSDEFNYDYAKGINLVSTKYLNGILYLSFENIDEQRSNAEDVKVD